MPIPYQKSLARKDGTRSRRKDKSNRLCSYNLKNANCQCIDVQDCALCNSKAVNVLLHEQAQRTEPRTEDMSSEDEANYDEDDVVIDGRGGTASPWSGSVKNFADFASTIADAPGKCFILMNVVAAPVNALTPCGSQRRNLRLWLKT